MVPTRKDSESEATDFYIPVAKLFCVYSAGRIDIHELRLETGLTTIGRGSLPEGVLSDLVSGEHARIRCALPDLLTISDAGSTNGTFLDGAPLIGTKELRHQSVLKLGDSLWVVSLEDESIAKTVVRNMIGNAASMRLAFRDILDAAAKDVTVLIHGQSGTGKERAARAIHDSSDRRAKPFVAINCGQLSEALLQSELFGHKKGAFTGAAADHAGVFQRAEGGTVFLDEIGDAAPSVQRALLRILEVRKYTRVGDETERSCDVRVIAATHRDLEGNDFRFDLYKRLAQFPIELPPLDERKVDILPLAQYRWCEEWKAGPLQLPSKVAEAMLLQTWPGNVRDLNNRVDQLHVKGLHRGLRFLMGLLQRPAVKSSAERPDRTILEMVIAKHEGNLVHAAKEISKSPRQLGRWLEEVGIDAAQFRKRTAQ